jgi:hypothetical protein
MPAALPAGLLLDLDTPPYRRRRQGGAHDGGCDAQRIVDVGQSGGTDREDFRVAPTASYGKQWSPTPRRSTRPCSRNWCQRRGTTWSSTRTTRSKPITVNSSGGSEPCVGRGGVHRARPSNPTTMRAGSARPLISQRNSAPARNTSISPAPCTGPPPGLTCRLWPTPATTALARASTPRTSNQATAGRLAVDNRAHNLILRSMRCLGERGFAILLGRWRTLRHTTASPRTCPFTGWWREGIWLRCGECG